MERTGRMASCGLQLSLKDSSIPSTCSYNLPMELKGIFSNGLWLVCSFVEVYTSVCSFVEVYIHICM